MIFAAAQPARAIDAVSVRSDAPAIDLTAVLDHQRSDTDRIQVSTAPGTDGIVRRIEVRAREGGQNWVVFALANNTDNARAIRFYERNGFAQTGGDVNPTSGRPVLRMEWKP
jgi:hypothetical protein